MRTVESIELDERQLRLFWSSIRDDYPMVTIEQCRESAARIKAGNRDQENVIDVLMYLNIKTAVDELNERNV